MKAISEYGWDNIFDVLSWLALVGCIAYTFILFQERPVVTSAAVASTTTEVRRLKDRVDVIVQPKEVEEVLKRADDVFKAHNNTGVIIMMDKLIAKYPKQPYPYVYKARALDAKKQIWDAIKNYTSGVKLNPNFVDKFSNQKIGPELKEIVRRALLIHRSGQMPDSKKKLVKNLYYLQRRLSGGCE